MDKELMTMCRNQAIESRVMNRRNFSDADREELKALDLTDKEHLKLQQKLNELNTKLYDAYISDAYERLTSDFHQVPVIEHESPLGKFMFREFDHLVEYYHGYTIDSHVSPNLLCHTLKDRENLINGIASRRQYVISELFLTYVEHGKDFIALSDSRKRYYDPEFRMNREYDSILYDLIDKIFKEDVNIRFAMKPDSDRERALNKYQRDLLHKMLYRVPQEFSYSRAFL